MDGVCGLYNPVSHSSDEYRGSVHEVYVVVDGDKGNMGGRFGSVDAMNRRVSVSV